MKLDIFCEMQKPRPWGPDHEQQIIEETLEQAKLADELGYGCWWQVEHHGAEEFSFSSAPELMLTAIARETKRIRVGHSAVLTPFNINHPIRIAERAAFLDRLSHGRLEMGFARSTGLEWGVFNVEPEDTRRQAQQAMEMVPKIWTSDRFSWDSPDWQLTDRAIVPKPFQKPHPPLWQAGSSPTSFERASRNGMGVLGVTLWTPIEEIAARVQVYRDAISEAEPVGEFINNQVALFTFVHCAETDQKAKDNGAAAAAAWYSNQNFTLFRTAESERGSNAADFAGGDFVGAFLETSVENPDEVGVALRQRLVKGEDVAPEEIYEYLDAQDALIAGDPDTCLKKLQRYADIGVDRLMAFQQVGHLTHEQITGSMRLVAELIPKLDPDAEQ